MSTKPASVQTCPPIPKGLQTVLQRALEDPSFRELLGTDRDTAIQQSGLPLSAQELAILCAIPQSQLAHMVSCLEASRVQRRQFLEQATLSVAIAVSSVAFQGCKKEERRPTSNESGATGGIRPDLPEEGRLPTPGVPKGARPEAPPPPPCSRKVTLETCRTLSGPERTPGEADQTRLLDQVRTLCGQFSINRTGKLTYVLLVDAEGAIKEVKKTEDSVGSGDLDTILQRTLERIVLFPASESSRVALTFALK